MDIVRGETLPDRRLERINREGIPAQDAIRLPDETVPHTSTPALVGKTDIFGPQEPGRIVQEYPQRPIVGIAEIVQRRPIRNDAEQRVLPRFVSHLGDTLGVIHHASKGGFVHLVDEL